MSSIRITFKDGTIREFPHEGRAGGSYTKALSFDGAFAVVTDEWGKRFCFPAADVKDIEEKPVRW